MGEVPISPRGHLIETIARLTRERDQLHSDIDKSQCENERLRAALAGIVRTYRYSLCDPTPPELCAARAALGDEQSERTK